MNLYARHDSHCFGQTRFATLWHKRYFPNAKRKRITLGTNSMLFDLIDGVDTWAIAPQSIAHKLICALQK